MLTQKGLLAVGAILGATALTYVLTSSDGPVSPAQAQGDALVAIALPDALSHEAAIGARMFDAKCASCHGENAVGRDGLAPPLVHIIYEPNHHGDESFQPAVALGVRAHHLRFGNMPAVEGLTRADVAMITTHIREPQRANGIF